MPDDAQPLRRVLTLAAALALSGCASPAARTPPTGAPGAAAAAPLVAVDSARLVRDLGVLADDSMGGRRTGTPGGAAARRYLLAQLTAAGVRPFGASYARDFSFVAGRDSTRVQGVNLVGYVPGTATPSRYLVVTAHYDHVGARGDTVYNGADDNASGSAALLEMARQVSRAPARHSVIFALLDGEELGLRGARALVADLPVPRPQIALDINMDMVGRNDRGELYAAGAYHAPTLRAPLERVAARAPVKLILGHDRPDLPAGDDWTQSSDHAAFHAVGIPFVYFGVEDHPDYHQPTDDASRIQPGFFVRATRTVLDALRELDRTLPESPAQ